MNDIAQAAIYSIATDTGQVSTGLASIPHFTPAAR